MMEGKFLEQPPGLAVEDVVELNSMTVFVPKDDVEKFVHLINSIETANGAVQTHVDQSITELVFKVIQLKGPAERQQLVKSLDALRFLNLP